MVMSDISITGGLIREALYKEDIKLDKGLDIIKNVIINNRGVGYFHHAEYLNGYIVS